MNNREEALKILEDSSIGTMASVRDGKPHSRYMMFFNDGFTIYTETSKKSEKVDEIKKNTHTHIIIGYEGKGFGDEYLEIEGTVSISDDESLKEKVWHEQMKYWFSGPEDPDLIILKVSPNSLRIMNKKGEGPKEITL